MRPVGHGIPTLTAQPASISFDYVGDQVPLLITAKFPDGPPVIATKSPNTTYLSGNTSVATVNPQGIVTAAGPGSTYILVSGVLEVPVYVPAPVVVMPPMASLYPGGAQQFTATLNIAASMGTVNWSATPPGVARSPVRGCTLRRTRSRLSRWSQSRRPTRRTQPRADRPA
jgi:hypothetical protein